MPRFIAIKGMIMQIFYALLSRLPQLMAKVDVKVVKKSYLCPYHSFLENGKLHCIRP